MAARGLGKSIHSPFVAVGWLGPGATWRGVLSGVLLAAAAIGGTWIAGSSTASSATLNLNGVNVTLPDGTVFTTPFLTGSNNVTNNGPTAATLIEGGGPVPATVYSGVISDGTSPTGWTHTDGLVDIAGANTYTGATTIAGGSIIGAAANAFSASQPD